MKFKARFLIEREKEIEAESLQAAVAILEKGLFQSRVNAKILGVIPADQEWPDAEKPASRPPRSTPPSGSPGTPSLPETTALLSCIAA